jgi:hypothetical protein
MSFEFKDVSEKDFPIVAVRNSVYKNVINDFIETQLQRGTVDLSGIAKPVKVIQTSLRRNAKGRNIEIVVNESKIAFFKKLD